MGIVTTTQNKRTSQSRPRAGGANRRRLRPRVVVRTTAPMVYECAAHRNAQRAPAAGDGLGGHANEQLRTRLPRYPVLLGSFGRRQGRARLCALFAG